MIFIRIIFFVCALILSSCATNKNNDYHYRFKMINDIMANKQNIIGKNNTTNDIIGKIGQPSFSDIDSKSKLHWYYLCSDVRSKNKKDSGVVLILDFSKEGVLYDMRYVYQPKKGIFCKEITKATYNGRGYILNLLKRLTVDKRDSQWQ